MAYSNLLASISEDSVAELQNKGSDLQASKIVCVSHLIAYFTVQPLGKTLSEALDGGEILTKEIGHPLRAPVWHNPNSVKEIFSKLQAAWRQAIEKITELPEGDWVREENEKVLDVFQHAFTQNEAIASFLDINNFDAATNRKIQIPVKFK